MVKYTVEVESEKIETELNIEQVQAIGTMAIVLFGRKQDKIKIKPHDIDIFFNKLNDNICLLSFYDHFVQSYDPLKNSREEDREFKRYRALLRPPNGQPWVIIDFETAEFQQTMKKVCGWFGLDPLKTIKIIN